MLKIHRNLLPHFSEQPKFAHEMAFSPVEDDGDELIQAIEQDRTRGDWQYDSNDAESLVAFWSGVEDDLKNDPEWVDFSED